MSYMWNEFNIKTFPAETIVYRDGVFCPELSTLTNDPINDTFDLPVHIIYIGEIAGKNDLNINVGTENQKVVLSVNIKNKKPAFFNIFIKNAGKNSEISGTVLMDNHSELTYDCVAHHLDKNTGILIKNKLIGRKNSNSKLSGTAIIDKDCENCNSDVGFVAMVEQDAKIDFMPAQRISSVPISAEHSASIYKPTDAQILYLRQAGLGTIEIDNVLKEAFLQD
ncbi:MAG: SufD family Fe-S cluster assembly protein [Alphaproteobacteria bacterium]|nr:SufD family Fe-S cluster assembly protein [Alphaproteobacteria bacterium]